MKKLNPFDYYRMGQFFHDLMVVEAGTIVTNEVISVLVNGVKAIDDFRQHEEPEQFQHSIDAAVALQETVVDALEVIREYLKHPGPGTIEFTPQIAAATKSALLRFESVLGSEVSDLPVYCLKEKGNYSLSRLINGVSANHPAEVKAKITARASEELDEAGRCIAFSRPTASAFHSLRAVELLVIELIAKSSLTPPPPSRSNWGEYIRILRDGKAAKEITDVLQIIKDTYRNPIMHPEETLDMDKAIGLFGICQSAIAAVYRHIP